MSTPDASEHIIVKSPHRALMSLTFPVLLSLIAEPVTGLVDTAFIAQLGSEALAALGVGTMALSGVFWIFNFLGIGTQTEVAQALGTHSLTRAARMGALALLLGAGLGILLASTGYIAAVPVAHFLGATGIVADLAQSYIRLRLIAAPAVLVTIAAFGALRGMQDMRSPLYVAVGINALNIGLDVVLIYGWGPIPALGVDGAAIASLVSWWLGAIWAVSIVLKRLGFPDRIPAEITIKLLRVGGDLFIRTGFLTLFLLLGTRTATLIGPEAGAAHQAVRQVWVFTSLFLDAFAISGQSLIGFFIGGGKVAEARRIAAIVCLWSGATGTALALIMWTGWRLVAAALVPPEAISVFMPGWFVAAAMQPLCALSFATDGIHWGTGDFRFLRNVVVLATFCGSIALVSVDTEWTGAFTTVWVITGGWIVIRALFGILRIWPGIGKSPLTIVEG